MALNLEPGSVVEANKNIQLSGSFKDLELAHAYGDFSVSTSDFTEEIELSEDLSEYFDNCFEANCNKLQPSHQTPLDTYILWQSVHDSFLWMKISQ